MLSQEKGKFKEIGKFFGVFICLCSALRHGCGDLCISRGNPLISEGTKQNYLQIIVYICSNMSEGCLKDWWKALILCLCHHTGNSSGGHCSKTLQTRLTIFICMRKRVTIKTNNRAPEAQEHKLRSFFWKWEHSKAASILGNWERHAQALAKTHAQRKLENTPSFHFGLIYRFSASH